MGYSQLSDVKEVLRIDESDTMSDIELTNCITSGDGLIDSILKSKGFTVPLSSPYPETIKDFHLSPLFTQLFILFTAILIFERVKIRESQNGISLQFKCIGDVSE